MEGLEGCYVAGADPELMVISPEGELTSAIPLIKGTKKKPQKVKGGAVQRDNVMAEFNVTPARSSDEFEANIRVVLGSLAKLVRPNRLAIRAYAEYPKAALDHPEAQVFGCDPDFCAWPNADGVLMMNHIPSHKALEPYRSAGGHFHVGYKAETEEMLRDDFGKIEVVKMLDIFQGIPSVVLDPDPTAKSRRALYGTAGAHRPKEYGVEYRALGNFWLNSPALVHLMYELADVALKLTLEGESQRLIEQVGSDNVQAIINKSQPRKAKRVIMNLLRRYLQQETYETIRTYAIPKEDLYQAWRLT
jgi:hypothetical protein